MKNSLHKSRFKIKSGALQLTLYISVLIAFFLLGLVTWVHSHKTFLTQSSLSLKTIRTAEEGITSVMNSEQLPRDTQSVSPLQENFDLTVHSSFWGVYRRVSSISLFRNKKFVQAALLGTSITDQAPPALYLAETYKPLVLVEKAHIKGVARLPEQGVRPGSIKGIPFYGHTLVEGMILPSGRWLPDIDPQWMEYLLAKTDAFKSISQSGINLKEGSVPSFSQPSEQYFFKGVGVINGTVSGHVEIFSDSLLRIAPQARLNDVLLIAPYIHIEEGFKGNLQAIATRQISVGKGSRLEYPSALIVLDNPDDVFDRNFVQERILIEEECGVKGSVVYLTTSREKDADFLVHVAVSKNAFVNGEVYCSGNLELDGTVWGRVITSQFCVRTGGSFYVNHLFGGSIDGEKLPYEFCGIPLEGSVYKTRKRVAKWMY